MNGEWLWNYAFNVIVNSTLSYLTTFAIILLFLFLLRIKQSRVRALCLSLPIFKIIVDFFLYDFQNWAFINHINPLESEPGTRMLSAMLGYPESLFFPTSGIQLFVNEYHTFTLADIAVSCMDTVWMKSIVTLAVSISVILCVVWLIKLYRSLQSIRKLLKFALPCERVILNPFLDAAVQKSKVQMLTSKAVNVPCAFGFFRKYILLPQELLLELTDAEFEAVIAHELDHLSWHDCYFRILGRFICTLFWWIPAKWSLSQVEKLQEQACDNIIYRFNISRLDLASAICKAVKYAKYFPKDIARSYFVEESSFSRRLKDVLQESRGSYSLVLQWIQYSIIVIVMSSILFGKFWIF